MASSTRAAAAPSERLLAAAAKLFPKEGIRAVGVDRVLAEAQVARASLYQAFGSKDALIAAYVDRQDELDRATYAKAVAGLDDPADRLLVLFDLARATANKSRFRGCLYLNAATEFPDQQHPVVAAVARHRDWLRELLVTLLTEAGANDPEPLAGRIQVIYDGAVAGSKLNRNTGPIDTGRDLATEILAERTQRP